MEDEFKDVEHERQFVVTLCCSCAVFDEPFIYYNVTIFMYMQYNIEYVNDEKMNNILL